MKTHILLSISAALLLAANPFADFITGTVLGSNGAPAVGVNIDAIRVSNGNDINLANDGTDAAGFFLTTIPADVYDLWFFPPGGSSDMTLVLRNVVVSGTKDLGTLQLQAGAVLTGHVQTQGAVPIATLNLLVTDLVTNQAVPLTNRRTDAFGNFQITVPKHAIELDFDATSVMPTFVVGSRAMFLSPTANTNLGNVVMPPGLIVTGHVQRSAGGTALAGVDLDFKSTTLGGVEYTPNDNTDALGNFSVVVKAGTYNVDFAPTFATHIAGKRRAAQSVAANLSLGTVALDNGAVLSGTIKSWDNIAQLNGDVDVYRTSTGEAVPTAGDNSNASGAYQVIVPLDNLKVVYRPPSFSVPLSSDVHTNVIVTVNTTLNGVLPACAAPNNYGTGLAGTGGIIPHLTFSGGTTRDGNSAFAYELQGGRGGAVAILTISAFQRNIPFRGGRLLVDTRAGVSVKVIGPLGGTPGAGGVGTKHVAMPFPLGFATNSDIYAQFAVLDSAAVQGYAFSEGLHFKVCP
ncbi:MAG: hypothetical protein EXS08_12970 [Planctomycetes bacterium]|nr:hypothetical protein [Planctomycetota bacterium]